MLSGWGNNSAVPVEVCPGEAISREVALQLICCADSDLPNLLAAARAAKKRFKPGVITYSRKVFIPLTNLCRDYCGYCTFRRDPGDPGAHTMTPDEVLQVARAGQKLGCTEATNSQASRQEGEPENSGACKKDRAPLAKGKFAKRGVASCGASWVEPSRKEAVEVLPLRLRLFRGIVRRLVLPEHIDVGVVALPARVNRGQQFRSRPPVAMFARLRS